MTIRQKTTAIRQDIINTVEVHPSDIAAVICQKWSVSRQAANKHLKELCDEGILEAAGRTTARTYTLNALFEFSQRIPVPGLSEEVPWREYIGSRLVGLPKNVSDICHYGFTEMLNNAIDHSGSGDVELRCIQTAASISITIQDFGIGIFKKIKDALHLSNERDAILELVKGKVTTDPEHHTGEGVFFTSRLVDLFSIRSGGLFFAHVRPNKDWLIEESPQVSAGTSVNFAISPTSKLSMRKVFDEYTDEDYTFSKTHVPVRLAQYGQENLISRSQAKRVLSRFGQFSEVLLDFNGVEFIGRAFADEIFRVFQTANPHVKFVVVNACPSVRALIDHSVNARGTKTKVEVQNID